MQVKKQFETDADAEKFLHWVKKWHDLWRVNKIPPKPRKSKYGGREIKEWEELCANICPLKIDILNTDAAQLNLINELTK